VVQQRGGARFADESRSLFRIGSDLARGELDRYRAVEFQVLGLEDRTHRSLAQSRHDAVVRNNSADHPEWPRRLYRQPTYCGCLLYSFVDHAGEQADGLKGADAHNGMVRLGQRQRVEGMVKIVAMLGIEPAMQQQITESAPRKSDAVCQLLEKLHLGRRSLQHGNETSRATG